MRDTAKTYTFRNLFKGTIPKDEANDFTELDRKEKINLNKQVEEWFKSLTKTEIERLRIKHHNSLDTFSKRVAVFLCERN